MSLPFPAGRVGCRRARGLLAPRRRVFERLGGPGSDVGARSVGPIVLTFVLAGLLTACSSTPSGPGVASIGSATSTTNAASASEGGSNATNYADAVAYARCMRAHGVDNFPDPNSKGDFLSIHGKLNGQIVNTGSARYSSADRACRHLLPDGGHMTAAEQQQALAASLRFTACIRAHGIVNFPDAKAADGGVTIEIGPGSGISPSSPKFQAAQNACQHLMPGGGP